MTQCRCKAGLLVCGQWERTPSYLPLQGSSEKIQTHLWWELQPWSLSWVVTAVLDSQLTEVPPG